MATKKRRAEEPDPESGFTKTPEEVWEGFTMVARFFTDGRYHEALSLASDLVAEIEGGTAPAMTLHPYCLKCGSLAEVDNPGDPVGRKVRCQDRTDLCVGNLYGRMSPEQVRDYIQAVWAEKEAAREAARSDG